MDNVKWKPLADPDGTQIVLAVRSEGGVDCEIELIGQIHSEDKEEGKKRAALFAGSKNMYSTLRAIQARIKGEWDNPHLIAKGPLGDTNDDILSFVEAALKEVRDNI